MVKENFKSGLFAVVMVWVVWNEANKAACQYESSSIYFARLEKKTYYEHRQFLHLVRLRGS